MLVRIQSNLPKVPGAVLVGNIVGVWEILLRPVNGQLNSISTVLINQAILAYRSVFFVRYCEENFNQMFC